MTGAVMDNVEWKIENNILISKISSCLDLWQRYEGQALDSGIELCSIICEWSSRKKGAL